MDPLSISASLLTILQITGLLLRHVNGIKNASQEQQKLAAQLNHLTSILSILKHRIDGSTSDDAWFEQFKTLAGSGGAIDQVNDTLQQLQRKVENRRTKVGRVKARIAWNSSKNEIDEALAGVDRFLSAINLALQDDAFKLTLNIKKDTVETAKIVRKALIDDEILKSYWAAVEWLRPPDSSQVHSAARQKHLKTSGGWLLNHPLFLSWLEAPSCLWLHGKPGAGKTILSSTVIEHVLGIASNGGDKVVAYFYFEHQNDLKRNRNDLLRSLLVQLAKHRVEDMQILSRLHAQHRGDASVPNDTMLVEAFTDVASTKSHTYIVLDGLDESPPRAITDISRLICGLLNRENNRIHIFLASRFEKDIKDELEGLTTTDSLKQIKLSTYLVTDDINHYIRTTVENDRMFQKWSASIRKMMITSLLQKSTGMFQWVYCQLEELRKCVSQSMVKKTLSTLPPSLDETYSRILHRVEERGYTDQVIRILQVLFVANRRLRLAELGEFLAIKLGDDDDDDESDPPNNDRYNNDSNTIYFCEDDTLPDQNDIFQLCGGLITTLHDPEQYIEGGKYSTKQAFHKAISKGPEVLVSHISVIEYLLSSRCHLSFRLHLANIDHLETVMSQCCLAYLKHMSMSCISKSSKEERKLMHLKYPLAKYAARFWFEHINSIRQHKIKPSLLEMASRLLQDQSAGLKTWRSIVDLDHTFNGPVPLMIDRVYIGNLKDIKAEQAEMEKKVGQDIRGPDWENHGYKSGSGFYYACLTGNVAIVKHMIAMMSPSSSSSLESESDLVTRLNAFQGGSTGYAMAAAIASDSRNLVQFLESLGVSPYIANEGCRVIAKMNAHNKRRYSPYRW